MAENRKITELDLSKPERDHNFVVATPDSNYRLLYNDVAEFSSIDTQSGIFLDTLTISGVSVSTGEFDMALVEDMFDDLSGYVDAVSGNVDIVSGNLYETGQILEEKIKSIPDTFLYFNDVYNNNGGHIVKTYYDAPTPNIFLSGVTVNVARDLKVSMSWDGPFDDYAGTGYINDIEIPLQNTQELSPHTRRFEGHIDNLNAAGTTMITGYINEFSQYGVSGTITLEEVGPDPFPEALFIDDIINVTPAIGSIAGTIALKAGDTINVFVDYDPQKVVDPRQEITALQVADSGISNGTSWLNYNPTVLGNGLERTTIPITVSDRNGDHGVAIRAVNRFGATGDYAVSNIHFVGFDDSRLLDQTFPIITVSADGPTNYNGRTDGLREGESTQLTNTIANWDPLVDTVFYDFTSHNGTDVLISNPNVFENPKTLTFNAGIYVDQTNLTITATRTANGMTSSATSKVKVANGPEIENITIVSPARSSEAPHQIGVSDIKGGDIVRTIVTIDTQGSDPDEILISVSDKGFSDGSQTAFTKKWVGTPNQLAGDSYQYTVDIPVTHDAAKNGAQSISMTARDEYQLTGDEFTSLFQATVDNNAPTCSIIGVTYPGGQQAIKAGESATVSTNATDFDEVEYSKPDSLTNDQLDFTPDNVYSANKDVAYFAGDYNITENNFKIKVIKTSNGMIDTATTQVAIANEPITVNMNNLPNKLLSSPTGETHRFTLSCDQRFLLSPILSLSNTQVDQSLLTKISEGLSDQVYDITVSDSDTKGSFPFTISVFNLANIETNTCNPSDYNVEGFVSREIESHPNSLFGGLASIGTNVTTAANVTFENLSEAGSGPNGGTEYTLEDTLVNQVVFNTDFDDQFIVCDDTGIPNPNGNFVFNLDALSRASNADVRHPAKFLVKED